MSESESSDLDDTGRVGSRVHTIAVFALSCEIASFLVLLNSGRYFRTALIMFFLVSFISLSLCIRAAGYKQRGRLVLPLISAAIPLPLILLALTIQALGGIRYGH
jgi:hypothetical protein